MGNVHLMRKLEGNRGEYRRGGEAKGLGLRGVGENGSRRRVFLLACSPISVIIFFRS